MFLQWQNTAFIIMEEINSFHEGNINKKELYNRISSILGSIPEECDDEFIISINNLYQDEDINTLSNVCYDHWRHKDLDLDTDLNGRYEADIVYEDNEDEEFVTYEHDTDIRDIVTNTQIEIPEHIRRIIEEAVIEHNRNE